MSNIFNIPLHDRLKRIAVYKIRDKNTGLFRGGGYCNKYTKNGRVWRGVGPLKQHLSSRPLSENDEIIQYVLTPVGVFDNIEQIK